MKNKVLLFAYYAKNLGDDLLIKVLCDRYPNTQFFIYTNRKYELGIQNLKVLPYRRPLLLLDKITRHKVTNFLYDKYDISIILGGSIFIEGKSSEEHLPDKPYYILGCNFGPYSSEEYLREKEKLFKNAEDVCFRDTYSYSLFKHLTNTRRSLDVAFAANLKANKGNANKQYIIISVIDVRSRFPEKTSNLYYEYIDRQISKIRKRGDKIMLMSFCKAEGDEKAIKEIINRNGMNGIITYNYNGNIWEAINIIDNSKAVIGTRFHSIILGILLGKPIIPIIYSEKTNNMLKDINYKGNIINISKLNGKNIEKADEVKFFKANINSGIEIDAAFAKLDGVLRK